MNSRKEKEVIKRNAELKQQLAANARKLKIEDGLEKVRAVALKMKKPADMLEVCKTISLQLQKLGVKEIRNVQTAIFYESKGAYMNYEYYTKHKKIFITETVYTNHKIAKAFASQMLKGKGEVYITHIKGKKVKDWIAYQKTTNVFIDRFLEKTNSLSYYWHSLGPVALGISTYYPLSEEELSLFKRFLKVFELAYKRYMDIEQAMEQARAAQIEAALERVRAVAMSMRKPEDLAAVSEIIFTELRLFGFDDIRNTEIIINKDTKNTITSYYYSDYGVTGTIDVDITTHPTVKHWMEELKMTSDSFAAVHISEKEMKEWRKYRESLGYLPDPKLNKVKTVEYYSYSIGPGALSVSSFKPITDEQLKTLERFKNVFGLAYRRYADVAKAEAQAREAKIETALERVRARTMAMQKSDELSETSALLFAQIKNLGIETWTSGFNIWQEDETACIGYNATPAGEIGVPIRLPLTEDVFFKTIYDAKKRGDDFIVFESEGASLAETYRYMLTLPVVKDVMQGIVDAGFELPKYQVTHCVFFPKGHLMFITLKPQPEAWDIFKRFGKVFEQTYTRFLDLQKAEVQAREAKIEAALERTRTQSMIMQHSKELDDTLRVFHEQVLLLGIPSAFSFLWLPDENNDRHIFWAAWGEEKKGSTVFKSKAINYPLDRNEPATAQCLVDWKSNEPVYSYHVPPVAVENYFAVWQELIDGVEHLKPEYFTDGLYYVEAFMKYGCFGVMVTTDLTEDEKKLLNRFAIEFERTYTRFLDLQKAEAQARESQIQLALERVRARTMAMQKSSELQEVVNSVYERLNELEVGMDGAAICTFIEGTKDYNVWIGDYQEPLRIKFNEITQVQRDYNDAIERREELFTHTYYGEIKKEYIRFLLEQTVLGINIPEEQKELLLASAFFTTSLACTKNTVFQLYRYTEKSFSKEENDILKRFANVFEQAYTRFLDLQKAEAQAKEAQIEAALEKVRSRSLAMHTANELGEVVKVIVEKLMDLGVVLDANGVVLCTYFNNSKDVMHWIVSPDFSMAGSYLLPYFDHSIFNAAWQSRENGDEYFSKAFSVAEKNSFFEYAFEHSDYRHFPEEFKQWIFQNDKHSLSFAWQKNSAILIPSHTGVLPSEEDIAILKRFAKVFEQSYVRFLDLQKAEAQTRESQIQLALERVRARTMAMQRSEELPEAANNLFLQVQALGIPAWSAGYCIWDEDKKGITLWMSSEGVMQPSAHAPCTEDPSFIHMREAYEKGEAFHVEEIGGEALVTHYNYMRTLPVVGEILDSIIAAGHPLPVFQIFHCVYFSQGFLLFITYENVPEAHPIFKRFTNVFEQTYTRFNDLKQAEEQARESQIQLALERVRARTMAMQKSDELMETAVVLFDQLKQLGEHIERTIIGVMNEGERVVDVWATRPDGSQMEKMQKFPIDEPILMQKVYAAWQQQKKSIVIDLRGEELETYFQFLKSKGPRLKRESFGERRVENFVFFSKGMLGFISVDPNTPANVELYERFAAVFDQTYIRFNDLKHAEDQARESQIQLALERVRARTMAMQHSDELKNAAALLFQQVKSLGAPAYSCGYNIWEKDDKEFTSWMSTQDGSIINGVPNIPLTEDANFIRYVESKQKGEQFFVLELRGERMQEHYQYLKTIPAFKAFFEYALSVGFEMPETQIHHLANFSNGNLLFITLEPCPEFHEVFKRFAAVFEQTYTRFLDLQKAEAQAREAKIEVALEKVRSRSLAMHKADELGEVATVVFEKLRELDMPVAEGVAIVTHIEGSKDQVEWMENPGMPSAMKFFQPYYEHPILADYWNAKNQGLEFIAPKYTAEQSRSFFNYVFEHTDYKYTPQEIKDYCLAAETYSYFAAFQKNSSIFINDYSGRTLTEQEIDIIKRFSKVFEQAYVRFLDLQKAEAQARESQIQLALERVRARTMAMQKSDELGEVSHVMNEQLQQLNFKNYIAGFLMDYKNSNDFEIWRSDPARLLLNKTHIPYFDHPIFHEFIRAKEKGLDFNTLCLTFEEKNKWVDYALPFFPALPKEVTDLLYSGAGYAISCAYMKNVGVYIENFDGIPFSEEENSILKRFGKVFEQTYTRFLDLQKAEAQARESQIELGLERVRARAMAMQTSGELAELVDTLFKELTKLDFTLSLCIINIIDEPALSNMVWAASPETGKPPESYYMKFEDYPFHHAMMKGYKERDPKFIYVIEGEEKKIYDEYLFNETEFRKIPEEGQAAFKAMEKYVASFSFSNFGGLQTVSNELLSESNLDILARFGKVFDLTYTRFNDLKQAEAQAREARIQLSLERVRARGMAMHSSNELADLLDTVFKELTKLDIRFDRCLITIYDPKTYASTWWFANPEPGAIPLGLFVKYHECKPYLDCLNAWKERILKWEYLLEGANKKEWDSFLFKETELSRLPELVIAGMRSFERIFLNVSFNNFGSLTVSTTEPLDETNADLLLRFAKVFDSTYTRFNDLKQAEAQAREAQIEAALERVRSRTMAMQHSDELKDAALLLFQQVQSFGVDQWACGYNIWEADGKTCTAWMSRQGNIQPPFKTHPEVDHCFQRFYDAKQRGESFYVEEIGGDEIKTHYKRLISLPEFKSAPKEFFDEFIAPEFQIFHIAYFDHGYLMFITYKPVPETWDIFKRFAKVFEQTYTRFLDLQKAEAQARESQIQLALERVRARTMAMQRSDELSETATVLFEQFNALDEFPERIAIGIVNEAEHVFDIWATQHGGSQMNLLLKLSLDEPHVMQKMYAAWKKQKSSITIDLQGKELEEYFQFLVNSGAQVKREIFGERRVENVATFSKGVLMIITPEPRHNEAIKILERFASTFDLTYTRFLDLQKAEAQTKEAKIEAALERVRARTMGMQKSDELADVVGLIYKQFEELDFGFYQVMVSIYDIKNNVIEWWSRGFGDIDLPQRNILPVIDHPFLNDLLDKLKSGVEFYEHVLGGELKRSWDEYLFTQTDLKHFPQEIKDTMRSFDHLFLTDVFMKYGSLQAAGPSPLPGDKAKILKRFTKALDHAYTRMMDLQNAEAQTREAKIEAALEKVRASTMAMQKSDDLSTAAFVLFQQFKGLGEEAERIFIATFDDDERWVDLWGTNQGGNQLNKLFRAPVDEPTVISKIIAAWKAKAKSVVVDLTGDELNKYVSFLKGVGIPVIEGVMSDRRVQTVACFSKGVIGLTTHEPRPRESVQLLERFAGVFDLTYTRFLDLTIAETKAHEARIEVALERVRARALAMQQPEELKEVAQVLRNEMGLLGVEELETSSIYIHPDNSEKVECWYALKDPGATEKRMVSDHFDLDLNDTWVGREMQKFYTSKENQTSIVMQGANRKEWIEYCYKHSPVFSGFYGETIPDRTYHLYKFSHGYIGAAAPGEISNESWRLLSRAASVFSLAYSRFKDLSQARIDLVKLKEEKKRAEDALTDLQAAQKQLVQAEKMASLGELTAGIAHEIQNPLNFVNNFSDVSNELLDEMKAELEKGNAEEAKLIAVDVKENLEKILHHGKRADAIVKGMLQHSRTSSGQKEPTDINVLAEEYLRLAYHGLRAKDKFFNAKFETDLDPSISKINIVPQEIGRVILNLINNSFYAVGEKKKTAPPPPEGGIMYEPVVTVTTKRFGSPPAGGDGGRIEIRVADNGNGIPQKVLDKIFQPFFTTKPTGQGTGLGLSLSYDIVTKGHDGEIKVETKEGEGSAFTISLPMK